MGKFWKIVALKKKKGRNEKNIELVPPGPMPWLGLLS
jgi:hypothetical protein